MAMMPTLEDAINWWFTQLGERHLSKPMFENYYDAYGVTSRHKEYFGQTIYAHSDGKTPAEAILNAYRDYISREDWRARTPRKRYW